MKKKRPADGFMGFIISPRYSRIEFIFNFIVIFIFKFLNFYAQPVSLYGAHTSGRGKCSSGTTRAAHWHARPREHCSSGTWGTARAAQRGACPWEHCFSRTGGPPTAALSGQHVPMTNCLAV
jgi:hypothetical protein